MRLWRVRRISAGRLHIRSKLLLRLAPGAGGVVVGIGGLLGGALGFGDVAEVYADAVPDVGGTAHAVGEDVIFGEVSRSFGVLFAPAGEAGFGSGFVWRLGDGDQRVGGFAGGAGLLR